jgi:hypothetical protein
MGRNREPHNGSIAARIAGKAPQVALVAIIRKVIETAHTLVKTNPFWQAARLSSRATWDLPVKYGLVLSD